MKRIYSIYFIFGLMLIFLSCRKSFLDVENKNILLRQMYVVDLRTMEHFVNGIYLDMSETFFSGYALIYPELVADNIKPVSNTLSSHYDWSQQSESEIVKNMVGAAKNINAIWASGYRMARNCSYVIEDIGKYKNENTSKADDLAGQAYVLRAWCHFTMVNLFAQSYNFTSDGSHIGIPYVNTSDWSVPVSRQTVAEVYAFAISDIQTGLKLLSQNSEGGALTINRMAAKALLARIYLFKNDFENAKNIGKEVTTAVPLMTIANGYPVNIFKNLPLVQTESLFQLSPSSTSVDGASYNTNFPGHYFALPNYLFNATSDIATILTESSGDIRSSWIMSNSGKWDIKKYPSNIVAGFPAPGTRAYYQSLLRSTEMFLTCAECYARLNKEDSSRFFLNAVRVRAYPSITLVNATGAALIDSIYKERRKEFAFEGFRMFDLQRLKKGVSRIDAPNSSAKNLSYPNNKAIAPIHGLDVDLYNLPQNDGY